MSTALVSGFYDFTDVLCKQQSHGGSHFMVDRKALARRTLSAISVPASNVPQKPSPLLLHKLSNSSVLPSPRIQAPQSPISSASSTLMTPQQQAQQGSREHRKLDRSVSEPAHQQGGCRSPTSAIGNPQSSSSIAAGQAAINAAAAANQGNSSRYKTELCRPFEENGTCKYGDKCQFAHGYHELRTLARHPKYKTELCRTFHTTGFCPYGPRCHFIHNSDENKKTMIPHHLNPPRSSGASQNNSHGPLATRSNSIGGDIVRGNHQGGDQLGGSRHSMSRPKALSIGSFSLGSTGDLSPPSSSSASPTSLNGFFSEDPFFSRNNQNQRHQQPSTPNTAFSFSQDFAALVAPKTPTAFGSAAFRGQQPPIFGGSQPSLVPRSNPSLYVGSPPSSDFLSDSVSKDPLFKFPDAPPSPADSSLSSELENLSLGGASPEPFHQRLQNSPSNDGNKPRLAIFSQFTNSDSE